MALGVSPLSALSGLFSLANAGQTQAQRVPMVFTSELRQRESRLREILGPSITATRTDILGQQENTFFTPVASPTIVMAVNPNSIRFEQNKRITKQDVRDGSVFFHFSNRKGQNNDILKMRFRGNTGNIDLRGSLEEPRDQDTGALRKLQVWHNLYLLTREPMLLDNGTENVFTITYASPLFPVTIDFDGFFDQVLSFEESAEQPNTRDYEFSFTVTATNPDLDEAINDTLSVLRDAEAAPTATSTQFGDGVTVQQG